MIDEATRVVEHSELSCGYSHLTLEAKEIAATVAPGQFVHLQVPGLEASALRRPFSVLDADAGRGLLHLLYRRVGRGTAALNSVMPGDRVMVEGPLGKGFPLECEGLPVLVGGGYGVAPLYFLARRMVESRAEGAPKPVVFIGGRTKDDLLELERFASLGVETVLSTNDGSEGMQGLVTDALDMRLAGLKEHGDKFELFACGPDGMLKAVADRAKKHVAKGWISMDRHMVCGVGACYACIQRTRHGNMRCCVDGPVFSADDLVWL